MLFLAISSPRTLLSNVFTRYEIFGMISARADKQRLRFQISERRFIMLNLNGVEKNEFIEYKGKPLVRQGNEIVYGDMSDKHYIFMMIMSEKETENGSLPDKIMVQLFESASKSLINQKIVSGFKEAFEFADAWLERYNK